MSTGQLLREPNIQSAAGNSDAYFILVKIGLRDVVYGGPEDLVEKAHERLNDENFRKAIDYALEVANADREFDAEQ